MEGEKKKSTRGFGSLTPERMSEIARKGGRAAHQKGRAHKWNSSEAKIAGAKGGAKVSANRDHMARIGKLGGAARAANQKKVLNVETN